MEKDNKSTTHKGNLLPPSGRHSQRGMAGGSESSPFGHGVLADSSPFSHDISRMPDNPPKNLRHRRAHSEIIALPDDISFDSDLGIVGGLDGPSLSDDTEEDFLSMYLDMDKFSSSSATSASQAGELSSADASVSGPVPVSASPNLLSENVASAPVEKARVRHQHSQSMDGTTTIKPEMLISGTEESTAADSKKAISAAKLAELALVDPKRAKRIWANRQSAARSKERKMRYIAELERKVQTLQTEATSLSAQLTLLQRDTGGLTAENSELKLRLQTMEQQVHLQDALNDALKEEIQHLKVLTGQTIPNGGGPMMNFLSFFGANHHPFPTNNHSMNTLLTAQQFQQLQIHSQKHQQQQQLQLNQFHQQHQQPLPQLQPQLHLQEPHLQLTEDSEMLGGTNICSSQKESASDKEHSSSKD
ncbi:hypothetical protein NMG60_11029710 [Bertholletia excelsa]